MNCVLVVCMTVLWIIGCIAIGICTGALIRNRIWSMIAGAVLTMPWTVFFILALREVSR